MSYFFFLINAGESVIRDLKLVLIFKDHQVQIYSHVCRIIWENSWGEFVFFFFFNLNASSCT